jgi:hypothetical protein
MKVLELQHLRTLRVEAEVLDTVASVNLVPEEAAPHFLNVQYQLSDDHTSVSFKVMHEDIFKDAAGTEGASVAVDILATFAIPDDVEPSPDQLEAFLRVAVIQTTFPFYREAVASLLARIGATAMLVGMVRFDGPNAPMRAD